VIGFMLATGVCFAASVQTDCMLLAATGWPTQSGWIFNDSDPYWCCSGIGWSSYIFTVCDTSPQQRITSMHFGFAGLTGPLEPLVTFIALSDLEMPNNNFTGRFAGHACVDENVDAFTKL
jgi:hypothetical protein